MVKRNFEEKGGDQAENFFFVGRPVLFFLGELAIIQ
jgi:hypothetical protein